MKFRTAWLSAWMALLVICIIALVDVSGKTCDQHVPILLSRALTTDPWRGVILAFNLLAVGSSFELNSALMFTGFLGFLCAFLVSMFQTNAHNALIFVSAFCIMYECYPTTSDNVWSAHWWSTVLFGVACSAWLMYSEYVCTTDMCAECSWWYITEYLFFWSMFLLLLWKIPKDKELRDDLDFINAPRVQSTQKTKSNKKEVLF